MRGVPGFCARAASLRPWARTWVISSPYRDLAPIIERKFLIAGEEPADQPVAKAVECEILEIHSLFYRPGCVAHRLVLHHRLAESGNDYRLVADPAGEQLAVSFDREGQVVGGDFKVVRIVYPQR